MNRKELIKLIDKSFTFCEDELPQFEKGDIFIVKKEWEEMKLQAKKDEIIEPILISSQEANRQIITQRNKEILELTKSVAMQKNLILSIPELLAKIIRKKDINGTNKPFQIIFEEFCMAMDNHGVSYSIKKLQSKVYLAKTKLRKLEEKLKVEQNKEDDDEGVLNE